MMIKVMFLLLLIDPSGLMRYATILFFLLEKNNNLMKVLTSWYQPCQYEPREYTITYLNSTNNAWVPLRTRFMTFESCGSIKGLFDFNTIGKCLLFE